MLEFYRRTSEKRLNQAAVTLIGKVRGEVFVNLLDFKGRRGITVSLSRFNRFEVFVFRATHFAAKLGLFAVAFFTFSGRQPRRRNQELVMTLPPVSYQMNMRNPIPDN